MTSAFRWLMVACGILSGFARPVAGADEMPRYGRSPFVPALNRLYLAVPRRGPKAAEIRVYEVLP